MPSPADFAVSVLSPSLHCSLASSLPRSTTLYIYTPFPLFPAPFLFRLPPHDDSASCRLAPARAQTHAPAVFEPGKVPARAARPPTHPPIHPTVRWHPLSGAHPYVLVLSRGRRRPRGVTGVGITARATRMGRSLPIVAQDLCGPAGGREGGREGGWVDAASIEHSMKLSCVRTSHTR